MSRATFKLLDYDGDRQQISFDGLVMTAASHDAVISAADALRDAILAVTLGANLGVDVLARYQVLTPAQPSDPFAQVNVQWVARYTDNVDGSIHRTRIGTADLDQATIMDGDAPALDLTGGVGATLKSAFEAFVLNDGHAVTLNSVYYRE